MTHEVISTNSAPAAIGPYSQAIAANGFVYCAGQIGADPSTGVLADVVKTTILLVDIDDFVAVNAVYARHLPDPPPARSTFAVSALPKAARIEIEAIAAIRR
jgi:2-iminobutanoate/2-iminopropanoate deaminase